MNQNNRITMDEWQAAWAEALKGHSLLREPPEGAMSAAQLGAEMGISADRAGDIARDKVAAGLWEIFMVSHHGKRTHFYRPIIGGRNNAASARHSTGQRLSGSAARSRRTAANLRHSQSASAHSS